MLADAEMGGERRQQVGAIDIAMSGELRARSTSFIGTNDLTQYLLAMDRQNPNLPRSATRTTRFARDPADRRTRTSGGVQRRDLR